MYGGTLSVVTQKCTGRNPVAGVGVGLLKASLCMCLLVQGKRHWKRVLSRIKVFVFGEQGNYTRAHKDKNYSWVYWSAGCRPRGDFEGYIRHHLVT